tara:strand:- start:56 stop:346 length:291 start_codon:yes stop_codon:yes gene_type:complete
MNIQEKIIIGMKQAIVSRGKNKGMLKSKCPKMDTYGSAVWNAIQMYSNPYKVGMGHLFFMSKDVTEVYEKVLEIGKRVDLSQLDRDANVLREFNLM